MSNGSSELGIIRGGWGLGSFAFSLGFIAELRGLAVLAAAFAVEELLGLLAVFRAELLDEVAGFGHVVLAVLSDRIGERLADGLDLGVLVAGEADGGIGAIASQDFKGPHEQRMRDLGAQALLMLGLAVGELAALAGDAGFLDSGALEGGVIGFCGLSLNEG